MKASRHYSYSDMQSLLCSTDCYDVVYTMNLDEVSVLVYLTDVLVLVS